MTSSSRSARYRGTALAALACVFIVVALWLAMTRGSAAAVGYGFLAMGTVLAAFLINDPSRPRVVQVSLTCDYVR